MTGTPLTLTTHDSEKLLAALGPKRPTVTQEERSARNLCMALLMLDAGLRVGETVALSKASLYYLDEPVYQLRITEDIAKNHKERIIPLTTRCRHAIEAMQVHVWSHYPKYNGSLAFYQNDPAVPITTRQVERILRAAAMNSLGRPVHPHVLRHTFATRLMRTSNARVVQELLGHKHLSTTQIYTHPNQDDLTTAIQTLEGHNARA